jgi:hypothetical protein
MLRVLLDRVKNRNNLQLLIFLIVIYELKERLICDKIEIMLKKYFNKLLNQM